MKEVVKFEDMDEPRAVLGNHDRNLRKIKSEVGVSIVARGGQVMIEGSEEDVPRAARAIAEIRSRVKTYGQVREVEVQNILNAVTGDSEGAVRDQIRVFYRDRMIVPRSEGQQDYIRAIRDHDLVFCVGPAGTGKTYLAVAMAVSAVREGLLRKIILVRPAVEAGEKLGFLPGTMQEKVNPYLRPLYDALNDMMEFGQVQKYIERDVIEVVPLAFMRGRTLNESFIILDEAQNTTKMQMKMFLTRLGARSKAVVTGDATQIDLPDGEISGLLDAQRLFKKIPGIGFVALERVDIVRHRLVQEIVQAYERDTQARRRAKHGPAAYDDNGPARRRAEP